MLLVVDVGNTQTHFGAYDGERLLEHWRFATVRQSTADELGAALRNLLELRGYGFADLDASIVSSTVPQLEPEWTAMAERYLGHEMLSSDRARRPAWRSATTTRVRSAPTGWSTRSPSASASAAARCASTSAPPPPSTSSPREGEYLGGALMTGIEISLEALSERGARLPKVDLAPPRSVIGKNTIDAIRSGVVYGYAGAIDAILRRLYDELGERADVIATGGLARLVVPFTEEIDEVDDLLTLTGLRLLHERNA